MSWDATLTDDRGHCEGSWNYTHNCNGMIEACLPEEALATTGTPFWSRIAQSAAEERGEDPVFSMGRGSWWDLLDGKTGAEGAEFLNEVVKKLEAEPERFRAMNPENGWGSYDDLLDLLREMRDAVPEWPSTWSVSG